MTEALASLVDEFRGLDVLVVGDVVLDTYLSGMPGRLAEEAPVPVVGVGERRHVPGGAANVAANIAALGARPRLLSVIGEDEDGRRLRQALREYGVSSDDVLSDGRRVTFTSTRLVADSQLVVRFDDGTTSHIGQTAERTLVDRLRVLSGSLDAAIVADYGHGTMTPQIIEAVARLRAGSPRLVVLHAANPAAYGEAGVTLATLSAAQAAQMLGVADTSRNSELARILMGAGDRILDAAAAQVAAVTLDHGGAVVFERGQAPYRTFTRPTRRGRSTGVGDTFASTFSAALGAKIGTPEAAELASAAAAVAAARDGTAMCTAFELKEFLSAERKTVKLNRLLARLDFYRRQGKRIVFTNGCFDILHRGHITYLNRAKGLGDVLVIGVNSDRSVSRLKGPGRPVIPLADRMEILAALSSVDHIIAFDEDTPVELIRAIKPHVFVKGGDYTTETLPEAPVVEELGGVVHILPMVSDRSTTGIIERIRGTAGQGNGQATIIGDPARSAPP